MPRVIPLLSLRLLVCASVVFCAFPRAFGSPAEASKSGAVLTSSAELASLASSGDALSLWERATAAAAAAVVEAVAQHDASKSVQLHGTDLDELRIWHGQTVTLGVEADGQPYRYVVSSEHDWKRLAHVLPAAQGGLLPRHDWEALERDWLNPVSRGSLLPDFGLEGPVDVHLAQPNALQLFLPHASDAGTVRRVLLREGAAIMVRGARSVRLRRGLDLPAISLSEFAGIVTSDAAQQQPLGVMHMLAGVREAATARWNASHPDQSLGLVALELELSRHGAALLAAPASTGGQRLRVRRVAEGVIELLPRDGVPAGSSSSSGGADSEGAVALAGAGGPQPGAWPLTSVHPSQLQSYERLLRQLITSRLFRLPRGGGGGGGAAQNLRVATDVQLRLLETQAEATTLLQLKLELERRPKQKGAAEGKAGKLGGAADDGSSEPAVGSSNSASGGPLAAANDEPPDIRDIAAAAAQRLGPHETWEATVAVKGDAAQGTLRFVPLHIQRVTAAHDTVQLSADVLGRMHSEGNRTHVVFL